MRSVLVLVCLAAMTGATFAVAGAHSAPRAPRCSTGKVISKVVYVRRAGGAKHHATGCVPRSTSVAASLPDVLRKLRLASLSLAPRSVVRALGSPAARQVLTADGATDAALSARLRPVARAANVTHDSSSAPVAGPPGTGTILHYDTTEWDTNERDVGQEYDVTSETAGKRVKSPAKKTKRIKVKYLMNRCPDASGIAHGTLAFSLRETSVVGQVVLTEVSTFDGTITAHFADNARIASVEVNGTWSYTTGGKASRRSVSGTVAATNFRQGASGPPFNNFVDLKTAVTTGTDDGIATSGGYLGALVTILPGLDIQERVLDPLQVRVLGGACVNIVPDAEQVHVIPGGSVAIVAHLTDQGSTTFSGPMTAYNGSDRVAPTATQGNPNATFTYAALATAPAGGTDVVQLSHISRRGKGHGGTVTVVYDNDKLYFSVTAYSHSVDITKSGNFHGTTNFTETYGPNGPQVSPVSCDYGTAGSCTSNVMVGATRTFNGTVGRDTPPCSHTYETDTRPHLAQAAYLEIDPAHPEGQANLNFFAEGLEIGDVSNDACGAHTFGQAQPNLVVKQVSTAELLSGRSVSFSWDLSGTVPASAPNHTGEPLSYTQSGSVTLHRVLADGSPYGSSS